MRHLAVILMVGLLAGALWADAGPVSVTGDLTGTIMDMDLMADLSQEKVATAEELETK